MTLNETLNDNPDNIPEGGKSTITKLAKIIEPYINADEIKRTNYCTDLEAAVLAEKMRESAIADKRSFTFETVLSTDRNLRLLQKAKSQGYFIRCFYILAAYPEINVSRVRSRAENGCLRIRLLKDTQSVWISYRNL